jgi:hypothetical protein
MQLERAGTFARREPHSDWVMEMMKYALYFALAATLISCSEPETGVKSRFGQEPVEISKTMIAGSFFNVEPPLIFTASPLSSRWDRTNPKVYNVPAGAYLFGTIRDKDLAAYSLCDVGVQIYSNPGSDLPSTDQCRTIAANHPIYPGGKCTIQATIANDVYVGISYGKDFCPPDMTGTFSKVNAAIKVER